METAIQEIAVISFIILGLSHIIQPRAWAQFFIMFRRQGEAGSFLTAFLHLPMGALIVAFHNVWTGIPLLLTLMGWGYVIKSLLYFVYPQYGVRMLSRVSVERAWEFAVGGLLMVGIGGILAVPLLRG